MSDTVQPDQNSAPEGVSAAAPAAGRDEEPSALLTRLRVIEDQPLETRAESLAQLHDELREMLEAGDAPPHA